MSTAPHIFVLTLAGAEARRAPLLAALDAMGFAYELWMGVDGRGGLDPIYEAMIDRNAVHAAIHRPMGDGEFGCALSHHLMYREIIARNLEGAIILEDDAIIGAAFARAVTAMDIAAADLVLFDHRNTVVSRHQARDFCGVSTARRLHLPPFLTTGYAVSRKGAAGILAMSTPVAAPADWPCDISRLDAWALDPRIVDHPDVATSSSNIRHERRKPDRRSRRARFLKAAYWRRFWKKHTGVKIA